MEETEDAKLTAVSEEMSTPEFCGGGNSRTEGCLWEEQSRITGIGLTAFKLVAELEQRIPSTLEH